MASPVLVVLDPRSGAASSRDPEAPLVRVDDAGYLRGDGVFETVAVLAGAPHRLDEHLARLAASADAAGLALPPAAAWRDAILLAVAQHDAVPDLTVRLTAGHTRGDGAPLCAIRVEPTADARALRASGVAVAVLDRGYRRGATADAPWLLGGVKTTSGAVTRAALREAKHRGADDVVWRTADGWLLEGATSSLVVLRDGALRTPASDGGILEGTTVLRVLEAAEAEGLAHERAWLPVGDLASADAAWLVSSTRRAVPIRTVDGTPLDVDHHLTELFEGALTGDAAPAS